LLVTVIEFTNGPQLVPGQLHSNNYFTHKQKGFSGSLFPFYINTSDTTMAV